MTHLVLDRFLPYRLSRLSAVTSGMLKRIYGAKYGLTVPEWRVIATLGEFGSLTAKDIGKHSAMHKTKVSRAVATLTRRRWLTRKNNSADRREAFVSLTSLGSAKYAAIVPDMMLFEAELRTTLSDDKMEVVERALGLLEQALQIRQEDR